MKICHCSCISKPTQKDERCTELWTIWLDCNYFSSFFLYLTTSACLWSRSLHWKSQLLFMVADPRCRSRSSDQSHNLQTGRGWLSHQTLAENWKVRMQFMVAAASDHNHNLTWIAFTSSQKWGCSTHPALSEPTKIGQPTPANKTIWSYWHMDGCVSIPIGIFNINCAKSVTTQKGEKLRWA